MKKILFLLLIIGAGGGGYLFLTSENETLLFEETSASPTTKGVSTLPKGATTKPKTVASVTLPPEKILDINYPITQTFNNCPAAGTAIALSYYGIKRTQVDLAKELRPYNYNMNGKNDDKSTPPEEIVALVEEKYGLKAYYRPNGTIELLKQFIANDTPILMRTLLNDYEDYHHYRVIKGYDETTKEIIQDDSYYGRNLRYKYSEFLPLWKEYNYEYIVFARPGEEAVIERIMGEDLDPSIAWQNSVARAENEVARSSKDRAAKFNLIVSLYYTGEYARAIEEFEKIEPLLHRYSLWFRIEPIKAYFELGNDARVFAMSDKILADNNPAYSELYLLRGKIHLREGQTELAKKEFEKAVFYNTSSKIMREALASVGN